MLDYLSRLPSRILVLFISDALCKQDDDTLDRECVHPEIVCWEGIPWRGGDAKHGVNVSNGGVPTFLLRI